MGWKEKMLSMADKEILIKSILFALPQYVMLSCKLPDSLCKRIMSIIVKFWWSTNGKRSIHWGIKLLLCKPKEIGGLNYRDLSLMNDAFLAKQ